MKTVRFFVDAKSDYEYNHLMPVTLYRAATRSVIRPREGACFAAERADAESYRRNPGFGGAALLAVEVDPEAAIADLTRARGGELLGLAAIVADEEADARDLARSWRDDGYDTVFSVLESVRGVEAAVRTACDWLVYTERRVGEPEHSSATCTTWRYYGDHPMVGRLV